MCGCMNSHGGCGGHGGGCPCQGGGAPHHMPHPAHMAHVGMGRMPLIGDAAPAFIAQTTNGIVNFPSDYAGKWVILFSHPADFTPVCTTEFMAFQEMLPELQALNTELIGLSIGTLTGHLAWLNAIREIEWAGMKNLEITFPLIDDMTMMVAKLYGMIQPGVSNTAAVRAVFIIDPNGIVRTILYYPPSVGRNLDEIRRTLIALQTSDAFGVSTPVDWLPGADVVIGSPTTMMGVLGRVKNSDRHLDVRAWFLAFQSLSAEKIAAKLRKGKSKK